MVDTLVAINAMLTDIELDMDRFDNTPLPWPRTGITSLRERLDHVRSWIERAQIFSDDLTKRMRKIENRYAEMAKQPLTKY